MIYALAYGKGGVGKSTVAVHLATYLSKKGKTLLIDADPQGSAMTWVSWRRDHNDVPFTAIQLIGKSIFSEGRRIAGEYDYTVVDVRGNDGVGMRNALLLADRVIVPMGNSGFDVVEIEGFKEIMEEASSFNQGLTGKILFNRMKGSTKDVEEFINGTGIGVFQIKVADRRAYANAITAGKTVMDFQPKDAAATYEMRKFFEEIESWA